MPVALQSYDFTAAYAFLASEDFPRALDTKNPGASEQIHKAGYDPKKVGRVISSEFPSLRSYEFKSSATPTVRDAMLLDVVNALKDIISGC